MRQPLKDLAAICAGQGAPQGDHNYCENGTPFVKAGNLQELLEGKAITSIQKVSDEVAKKHKLRLYPKGTILFAKSGMSCMKGYIYVLPQSAYVVSHLACITPNEDISEYLRYYFNYHKPNHLVKDAAYPSISLSDVGNLVVDMKPESERNEIVSVLQHTESIITLRQQQLQKLNELVKARFVEMFGDPVVNKKGWDAEILNSLCNGIGDGLHGTPEYDDAGKYAFINGNNLMNGAIEVTPSTKMVNAETFGKYYIEISENAILLSINGTLGKLAFYNGEEIILGKSACYCNLKSEINREFVYGVMQTNAFSNFLERNATASTIKNVGLKAIREFRLILPPEGLQKQFVKFSKQVDKSKAVAQKALDEAQLLFDSLMQKYFE